MENMPEFEASPQPPVPQETPSQNWMVYRDSRGRLTYTLLEGPLENESTMKGLMESGHQVMGVMTTQDLARLMGKEIKPVD